MKTTTKAREILPDRWLRAWKYDRKLGRRVENLPTQSSWTPHRTPSSSSHQLDSPLPPSSLGSTIATNKLIIGGLYKKIGGERKREICDKEYADVVYVVHPDVAI